MTVPSQTLRGLLSAVCVLIALVSWSARASAQAFELGDSGWEGGRGFVDLARKELGEPRVIATNKLDWNSLTPADGIIVIHPETALDGDELAAFLRAGGRAAILDDFGVGDRVLSRYQIRRVPAPARPLFALRSNPELALAEPVGETVAGRRGGVHPVVADVTRLVTNHPTGLIHPDLSTVLRIRASGEADVAVAVAGQVGKGRLFAMGDPSAIIVHMLGYPGNRAFALGLVKYMVDDDSWGSRQGRLIIVSNRFEEVGAYGAESSAARELREWARALRGEAQKIGGDGLPKQVALALSVAAAAALILWVASAAARVYKHPVPRFARPTLLVAQGGVAGRAAVLAAPTTHRGLVLLEQKDALEEQLGVLLGLEKTPSMAALLDELSRRRILDPTLFGELRRSLLIMARVETAVASGTPIRVSQRDLARAESVRDDVVAAIKLGAEKGGA